MMVYVFVCFCFKQKTSYEMRISDWSSDVCSSDLFDAAANAIYHFVWDQFCDWYIELIKGAFDAETKLVAGWVLDQILVMLHPFMPFVTEELWSKIDRKSVVSGQRVSVRVDIGGRRIIKKK